MSRSGRGYRSVAAVAAVVALSAGCGPRGAAGVLDETASKMGEISSGQLRLRLVASAGVDGRERRPVGFELDGPFSLPSKKGMLPLARLSLTRLRGGVGEPTVFVSTGDKAFIEVGGSAYELPSDQLSSLRGGEPGKGGLEGLDIADWAEKPKVTKGGSLDGVAVERVTAALDVTEALNDLVDVAARLGAGAGTGLRRIEGKSAEQLKRAVRSARLEVVTGAEDRLLRRLRIDVTLLAPEPRLVEALGPLAGTRLELELDIAKPNQPVKIDPPRRARPLEEFTGRG